MLLSLTKGHPDGEPDPGFTGKIDHEVQVDKKAETRQPWDKGDLEASRAREQTSAALSGHLRFFANIFILLDCDCFKVRVGFERFLKEINQICNPGRFFIA